jgi:hypothetical protein
MRLYNSDITTSNFEQVDGIQHNFPIIYTHGCICGSFDSNDCIAEEMLQLDRFASAFIGNSRYGWFNEGQTEGPSQHLHREFVDALYNDKVNFMAEAHLISKIESSGWVEAANQHEPGAIRWVFYDCNALGDPTLPIWTDELSAVEITAPDGILIGENQVTIQAQINSNPAKNIYISLAKNGTIYGSGTTNTSGNVTIDLAEPFTSAGEAEIIYSGYNILKDTILETLNRPQDGYLVVSDIYLGADTQPGCGKTYNVGLLIENVAENTSAINTVEISTSSDYVTINADPLTINEISGMGSEVLENCFELQISELAPDQSAIAITFDFYVDGVLDHTMQKHLFVQSPKLTCNMISISDETGGNNNGIFELGEIIRIEAQYNNIGSINPERIKAYISENTSNINVLTDTIYYTPEQENENTIAFVIETMPDAQSNQTVELTIAGMYDAFELPEMSYSTTLGLAMEDFETGDFTKYEWDNDNTFPWEITASDVYEGSFSAVSPDIDHDQQAELSITVNVPENDSISFMYMVSCEDAYSTPWDYLEFSIDGNSMDIWDGITEWERASYPITAGTHTFTWKYLKDGSVNEGEDCAWLDNIILPIQGYEPPAENNAPEILSSNIINCQTGQPFTHTITATDDDADPLEAHMVMAPAWVNLTESGSNEWVLSGNIPVVMELIPEIIIGVTDSYEFASQHMTLNVDGVSISDPKMNNSNIIVYPQPAKSELHIKTTDDQKINSIALFNNIGQMQIMEPISSTGAQETTIDISNFNNGIYFLQIKMENGQFKEEKILIH